MKLRIVRNINDANILRMKGFVCKGTKLDEKDSTRVNYFCENTEKLNNELKKISDCHKNK